MAADVSIDIELVTAAFNKALKESGDKIGGFKLQVEKTEKGVTTSFTKITAGANKASKGFSILGASVASFLGNLASNALTSFVSRLGGLANSMVDNTIKLEQLGTQFEVLTGSAEVANDTLEKLQEFAATTPFQLEGIATAGAQLLSFGVTADELPEKLKRIGDVAAAAGQPLREVSLIFGQVAAAGKLTGERLLQFQERAIPIGPALAKTFNEITGSTEATAKNIKDLVSQGKIDFEIFEKAFDSLSDEGGKAFQGMIKQSKTLGGVLSTLSDNFTLVGTDIGKAFLPIMKDAANAIITVVQENRELIKQFASRAAAVFAETIGNIISTMQAFAKVISENRVLLENLAIGITAVGAAVGIYTVAMNAAAIATGIATAATTAFNAVLAITPWGIAIVAATALVAGIRLLVENFDEIVGRLKIFAASIIDSLIGPLTAALNAISKVASLFNKDLSESINNSITNIKSFSAALRQEGEKAITSSTKVKDAIVTNNKTIEEDEEKRAAKKAARLAAAREKELSDIRAQNEAVKAVQDEFEVEKDIIAVDRRIEDQIVNNENKELDLESLRAFEQEKLEIIRDAELEKAASIKDVAERARAEEIARQKFEIATLKADLAFRKDIRKKDDEDKKAERDREKSIFNSRIRAAQGFLSAGLTLAKQGSKEQKALQLAQATISTYTAATQALAAPPGPPFTIPLSAAIVAQGLANVSKITSAGSFQNGGVIGGASFSGDRLTANVNSNEVVLNPRQAANTLFQVANGSAQSSGNSESVVAAINSLGERISNMEITLQADDNELARSVSRGVSNGVVIGVSG